MTCPYPPSLVLDITAEDIADDPVDPHAAALRRTLADVIGDGIVVGGLTYVGVWHNGDQNVPAIAIYRADDYTDPNIPGPWTGCSLMQYIGDAAEHRKSTTINLVRQWPPVNGDSA